MQQFYFFIVLAVTPAMMLSFLRVRLSSLLHGSTVLFPEVLILGFVPFSSVSLEV